MDSPIFVIARTLLDLLRLCADSSLPDHAYVYIGKALEPEDVEASILTRAIATKAVAVVETFGASADQTTLRVPVGNASLWLLGALRRIAPADLERHIPTDETLDGIVRQLTLLALLWRVYTAAERTDDLVVTVHRHDDTMVDLAPDDGSLLWCAVLRKVFLDYSKDDLLRVGHCLFGTIPSAPSHLVGV